MYGLRIDVDTHEGMRDGVPAIRATLDKYGFKGSFFFSYGPDNSGRAVLRAFRKRGFLKKMLRTNAASMYGVRTMLSGTLLPSRPIANAFPQIALDCVKSGHEVGLHAWDHVAWQDHLGEWSDDRIRGELQKGVDAHAKLFGEKPKCSAAPAWFATERSLAIQDEFGFDYSSDCRTSDWDCEGPFLPKWGERVFKTPQIAASLQTLDELLGRQGYDLPLITTLWMGAGRRDSSVLTIHAEAEGRAYLTWFDGFCKAVQQGGNKLVPVREIVARGVAKEKHGLKTRRVCLQEIPGRAGEVLYVKK
jgi:peptidoglycan/xylan/chitin deacetylase (PgdA/CDA1 family)